MKDGLIKNNNTICLPDLDSKSSFTTSEHVCYLRRYGNDIKIAEFKTCSVTYGDLINEIHMVCVDGKVVKDGKIVGNNCVGEGETGAPLMCLDNNRDNYKLGDKFYLAGIASWPQSKCGEYYDVFTKLYDNEYLNWINETIRLN